MLSLCDNFFIYPFPAWVLLLRADFKNPKHYLHCWLSKPVRQLSPNDYFSQISRSSSLSFGCHDLLCLRLPFHFYLNTVQIVILKCFFRECTGKVKSSNYSRVWKGRLNLKSNLDWYVIPALIELVLRTLNYYLLSISFPGKRATESISHFGAGYLFLKKGLRLLPLTQ